MAIRKMYQLRQRVNEIDKRMQDSMQSDQWELGVWDT